MQGRTKPSGRRMRRLLRVRPGESRVVLLVLALMVVLWAGAAVGATGVESLFFARFGPEHLPWMYIALGLITFPASLAVAGLLGRSGPERVLPSLPLGMAATVVAMRLALLSEGTWPFPVLWLSMMVLWIVHGTFAWGVAGTVHHARQAKRLFPLYAAGVILGGGIGGLATGPLAVLLGAENLLIVWALALVGANAVTRRVMTAAGRGMRPARHRKPEAGFLTGVRRGASFVRRSELLRWMSVSIGLLALLYYSLSFPFALAVTSRFPEADELAAFLGVFQGVVYLLALCASLLVANRLLARFGVAAAVLTLPVLYLLGFLGVAAWQTFGILVAFRFVQLLWMFGVWQAGWQALFNVVPPEQRERARAFMDGGPMQAGVVAAGGFLLLAREAMSSRQLFLVAAALAVGAVAAASRVRRAYAGAVGDALRSGWPEVFVPEERPFGGIPWDRGALAALAQGAGDPDPGTRRIAMEILADVPLPEARPLRLEGLRDEDAGVRAAALAALARLPDPAAAPTALELLEGSEPVVRAAAVEAVAVCVVRAEEAVPALRPLLEDPEPLVRLRAAAALRRRGADGAALEVLRGMAGSPDPEERAAALAAHGELGEDPALVAGGLRDPEREVRCAAADALARFEPDGVVEELVGALGDEDPGVRESAAGALAGFGAAATPTLYRALSDDGRVEGALLALAHLPVDDHAPLRRWAEVHRDRALRWHSVWRALGASPDPRVDLLAFSVRHRALHHAGVTLRAEAVTGHRSSIAVAMESLSSRDPYQRSNALEMIETMGDPELVRPLLPVWDPEPDPAADLPAAVWRMIREEDPWVRACAAVAAGATLGWGGAAARLSDLARDDPDPEVRAAAASALRGREGMETLATVTLMDRVLALRQVPLFRELSPEDLKRVAEAAVEHLYPDGAELAAAGEPGDALHVVVSGEVRVLGADEGDGTVEFARLGPGYIVGEMAILSEEPRMGTIVAVGEVRTLSLDRARFQRILRERPEAALAVMRELCDRLRTANLRLSPEEGEA